MILISKIKQALLNNLSVNSQTFIFFTSPENVHFSESYKDFKAFTALYRRDFFIQFFI